MAFLDLTSLDPFPERRTFFSRRAVLDPFGGRYAGVKPELAHSQEEATSVDGHLVDHINPTSLKAI